MYAKRYRKRTTATKKRSRARARTTRTATGVFKKKVMSVINQQAEDKVAVFVQDPIPFDGIINSNTDAIQLVPPVGQGTQNNERVGDRISAKYMTIRGHLELTTSQNNSDGPTRVCVRVMVVSRKELFSRDLQLNSTTSTWLSNLIDYGAGNQSFDGATGTAQSIKSLYLPLNSNVVTKHYDKLHYLNVPRVFNTSGLQFTSVSYQNTIKFFTIKLKCKKILKYLQDQEYPANFNPVLLVGHAQLNGGSNTGTNTNLVKVHYVSSLYYQDV